MSRLLVIDDDRELCELLNAYLTGEGFEVAVANDPVLGIERVLSNAPDLIILDVMMPRMNGFEALRRIRASSSTPVLMLTARGDEVDRIVGLEIGADDYLPKPFNTRELVARIRAVLRRFGAAAPTAAAASGRIVSGDLALHPGQRSVLLGGQAVDLTSIEFSILEVLVGQAGQVVSRDELFERAMGRKNLAFDRSIDVHISSLRKKLGHHLGGGERIKTIRNIGYQYTLPG